MKRWIWILLLMLLIGTACATPTSVPATPVADAESAPQQPTETAVPLSPVSPVSVPPTPRLGMAVPEQFGDLRTAVAAQLQIDPEVLSLLLIEETTWRDTSLGCPKEGMQYAQVLVEGWRLVFEDNTGQQYPVHTAQDTSNFIICMQALSEDTDAGADTDASAPDSELDAVRQAAIDVAVERLSVSSDEISINKVEPVQWRNSCLGCEIQGQMCLTVITPGYRIQLDVAGKTYAVHTDRTGKQAVLCDKLGDPPILPGD